MTKPKTPRVAARERVAAAKPSKAVPSAGSAASKVKADAAATSKASVKRAVKPAANGAAAHADGATKPRHKLIRDSFTIPKSEYAVLESLKLRAAKLARPTKKSEVLRAGVAALSAMTDKAFLAALNGVPSLKTGRPKGTDATSASDKGTK